MNELEASCVTSAQSCGHWPPRCAALQVTAMRKHCIFLRTNGHLAHLVFLKDTPCNALRLLLHTKPVARRSSPWAGLSSELELAPVVGLYAQLRY